MVHFICQPIEHYKITASVFAKRQNMKSAKKNSAQKIFNSRSRPRLSTWEHEISMAAYCKQTLPPADKDGIF